MDRVLGGPAALLLQLQGLEALPPAGRTVAVLSGLRNKARALVCAGFSARLVGTWGNNFRGRIGCGYEQNSWKQ